MRRLNRYKSVDVGNKELYCTCRKPDDGRWMVCCNECEEWFHFDCVGFDDGQKKEVSRISFAYFCKKCSRSSKPKTLSASDFEEAKNNVITYYNSVNDQRALQVLEDLTFSKFANV